MLQYTGDGMLAAFGTEAASEDDVEAAVRAGLAIVEEAKRACAAGAARARRARLQRARRRAHRARAARRRRRRRRQHPRRHRQRRRAHGAERAAGAAAHQPRQLAPCARAVRVRANKRRSASRASSSRCAATWSSVPCRARSAWRPARHRRRGHAHGRPRGRARSCCATACSAPWPNTARARSPSSARPGLGKSRLLAEFERSTRPAGLLAAARPRAPAQRAAALRPAARHAVPASCRSPRAKTPAAARDKLVEALAPLFARRRRSADAPAGPADRAGLLGQPACRRTARRRSARSATQAFEAGALCLRRLGEHPAGGGGGAGRPALGRRGLAGLHALRAAARRATCRC